MPERQLPKKRLRYNDGYYQLNNPDPQNYDGGGYEEHGYQAYPYGDFNEGGRIEAYQYQGGQYEGGGHGDYYEQQQSLGCPRTFQYIDGVFYDEEGNVLDYAEGYEDQTYDKRNYRCYDGVYYDEHNNLMEFGDGYDQFGYYDSQVEGYSEEYDNYSQSSLPSLNPPTLRPRKAEFVVPKKAFEQSNPAKQPQTTKELEERSIHYNYGILDRTFKP